MLELSQQLDKGLNLAAISDYRSGNAAHLGIPEVLFFTKSHKWKKLRRTKWTTGRLLHEAMHFEDIQRRTTSRWLTDGSDHNRNNNSLMRPGNVAALPTLKIS